jgi:hypothetical protein
VRSQALPPSTIAGRRDLERGTHQPYRIGVAVVLHEREAHEARHKLSIKINGLCCLVTPPCARGYAITEVDHGQLDYRIAIFVALPVSVHLAIRIYFLAGKPDRNWHLETQARRTGSEALTPPPRAAAQAKEQDSVLSIQRGKLRMKATIFAAVFCTAVIGQINTASAQYYGPASLYYHYGSPAGACCALVPMDLGWAFTRNQPAGHAAPYPALQMADGTLGCEHANYRPARSGWCRRIW